MLPAWQKLRNQHDFNHVYKYGRRLACHFFVLWYLPIYRGQPSKFAVVTSIKKMGKATMRNRGRRRLWALLRKELNLVPATGYWFVFNLNKGIIKAKWPELQAVVRQIFQRIK
ncbi:MAG: ribonuclease P protein component [Patescibacteria group bacterium]